MSEDTKRSDFKEEILPNFDMHLQFALQLTRNGHDAVRLLGAAVAEALRARDEPLPRDGINTWLREHMAGRFSDEARQHEISSITIRGYDSVDASVPSDRLSFATTADARKQTCMPGTTSEDVLPFELIASLPAAFRSAMILSYVEGFSNMEIADLAGVRPSTVDYSLSRAHRFIREELLDSLMGNDYLDTGSDFPTA